MNILILVGLYFHPRALAHHTYVQNSEAETVHGGWLRSGLKLKQVDINM